jgi:hypothetical protein
MGYLPDLVDNKNRNEWVRIQSFSSFPSSIDISFLLLAHAGFYYTGIYAECRCFSCGKVYKKWKDGDNPYIMHRKISPECFYMNGRESGNVQPNLMKHVEDYSDLEFSPPPFLNMNTVIDPM